VIKVTKVRLAFYRHNKTKLDKLIAGYTRIFTWNTPPFSHVELGIYLEGEWKYFSSTMRNNGQGTRWISEKDLFKNAGRWHVYHYYSERSEEDLLLRIDEIIPAKYDMWGIFGFLTLFGLSNSAKKWYCSEACWRVLFKWKKRISPIRMYAKLKNKLHRTTEFFSF